MLVVGIEREKGRLEVTPEVKYRRLVFGAEDWQ